MKARISEIFTSIQGEGRYAGVRQVFVRFFGCSLDCAWCDTQEARDGANGRFQEMDADTLLDQVTRRWDRCHSVSLTGGEPLEQKDFLKGFLPRLKTAGMKAYLETNGVDACALGEICDGIDIISMDVKLPSSTRRPPRWEEHGRFLRIAAARDVFVKAVITADTVAEDMVAAAGLVAAVDPAVPLILQPDSHHPTPEVFSKCVEYQKICLKSLSDVRIMPQMHKLMGLR